MKGINSYIDHWKHFPQNKEASRLVVVILFPHTIKRMYGLCCFLCLCPPFVCVLFVFLILGEK